MLQFSLPSPPVIYYGTEVGVPQRRKCGRLEESRLPMLWGGVSLHADTQHNNSNSKGADPIPGGARDMPQHKHGVLGDHSHNAERAGTAGADLELLQFYRDLIAWRRSADAEVCFRLRFRVRSHRL